MVVVNQHHVPLGSTAGEYIKRFPPEKNAFLKGPRRHQPVAKLMHPIVVKIPEPEAFCTSQEAQQVERRVLVMQYLRVGCQLSIAPLFGAVNFANKPPALVQDGTTKYRYTDRRPEQFELAEVSEAVRSDKRVRTWSETQKQWCKTERCQSNTSYGMSTDGERPIARSIKTTFPVDARESGTDSAGTTALGGLPNRKMFSDFNLLMMMEPRQPLKRMWCLLASPTSL